MAERGPAFYTTVHPGVRQFLPEFVASLEAQSRQDFTLWLGLEGVTPGELGPEVARLDPQVVVATPQDGPVGIRQRAMEAMLARHPVVIFADADDLMLPGRVEDALDSLEGRDACACALVLADPQGRPLGPRMEPRADFDPAEVLPRANFLGLGNSVWRSEALARCLPLPRTVQALDWHLAVKALALGLRLGFDQRPGLLYRQYPDNLASVLQPFSARTLLRQTALVQQHLGALPAPLPSSLAKAAEKRKDEVAVFSRALSDEALLASYLEGLNGLPSGLLWWECVAHRALEGIWNRP